MTIAKNGKVKVSGTLADGKTKVSANAVFLVGDGWNCIPIVAPKSNLAFLLWLSGDGRTAVIEGLGEDAVVGKVGGLRDGAEFSVDVDADLWAKVSPGLKTEYLPSGVSFEQKGSKLTLPKAGKLTMKKGVLDDSKAGKNPSGLKLSLKKDGTFTGSFKVYADNDGKLKTTTVSVVGVLFNGVGYGTPTVKKVGSVPVLIK